MSIETLLPVMLAALMTMNPDRGGAIDDLADPARPGDVTLDGVV